jgi:hypothetical protein
VPHSDAVFDGSAPLVIFKKGIPERLDMVVPCVRPPQLFPRGGRLSAPPTGGVSSEITPIKKLPDQLTDIVDGCLRMSKHHLLYDVLRNCRTTAGQKTVKKQFVKAQPSHLAELGGYPFGRAEGCPL